MVLTIRGKYKVLKKEYDVSIFQIPSVLVQGSRGTKTHTVESGWTIWNKETYH